MRILPSFRLFRYLLIEAIPYIILTLLILTSLILAQQISRQAELLFNSAASVWLSARLIIALLPGILVITLPFSLLIGSLMALNRASADNEILAMRAGGINLFQISFAFLLLGVSGTIISAVLTLRVIPRLYAQGKDLRAELIAKLLTAPVKAQTFNTQFAHHLVYIREVDNVTGEWVGVFIIRQTSPEETLVMTAHRGSIRLTQTSPYALEISLTDGLLLSYAATAPEKQTLASFAHQQIRLSSENTTLVQALERDRPQQELSLSQLAARSAGAVPLQERRQSLVEWHNRLALPFACLILILLAVPIGLSSSRQMGRAVAFTIGFIIAILYYLLLIAGRNFALSGAIPVWLGVWCPNLLGLLLALLRPALSNNTHVQPIKRNKKTLNGLKRDFPPLLPPLRAPLFSNLVNYLLISELLKYLALSLGILVCTSLIFTLFDLLPSLSRSGLGGVYAATYLLYLAPQIIYYVTPFAVLLAVLTVHGVLARSQQITALLTSGLGFQRLLFPIVLCIGLLIAGSFWLSEAILPYANQEQDARYNRIKGKKSEQTVSALGQYWVAGEDQTIYGYQRTSTPSSNALLNTTAYRLSKQGGNLTSLIFAEQAASQTDTSWQVTAGWRYEITPEHQLQFSRVSPLTPAQLTVPEGSAIFRRMINEASKMRFEELRAHVRYLHRLGLATSSLRVDLEKKLAFPFSCLPLILLASAFTLKNNRPGTLAGIGLSIIIGFTFWVTASFFEGLGRQAYLPPGLSVWGPQALFLSLGVFLIFRLRK